jgi:hypothetical protein
MLGPHSITRGCGGDFCPTTVSRRAIGGDINFCSPPLGRGFRGSALEAKFWENLPCKIL